MWEWIQSNLLTPEVISCLISLIISIINGIIVLIRTSTKSIAKKIDNSTITTTNTLDLSKYYIEIEGQKYYLSEIEIKKDIDTTSE